MKIITKNYIKDQIKNVRYYFVKFFILYLLSVINLLTTLV